VIEEIPELTRRAHGKINLFLRVLRRREDGYHDLESLVLPLSLHDLVTVRLDNDLTLTMAGEHAAAVPAEGNLALAAARALAEACSADHPHGAAIEVEKRIPVAAGMGGGSADAAAILTALDELWACGLGIDRISSIGASLGSDVPALLMAAAVFVHGRGERVHPVHAQTSLWVIRPFDFQVRTPDAFTWWDEDGVTGPDAGALVAAAETGNADLLGSSLFNDLQGPVCARHPQIADTITAFLEADALGAVMTGSGPTVAALARHLIHAERLAEAVPGSLVVSGPPHAG
jgi:4-diphosphocytidyl-2-C-methyl-D-erythritol kinase